MLSHCLHDDSVLSTLLGFIGNLLVLLVVLLYRDFQNMRYFLLASLALSDWIFAALVASSRTAANAAEKWIFGTTWCHGVAFIIRVLHHSTAQFPSMRCVLRELRRHR